MAAKTEIRFSLCHRPEGDRHCILCPKEQRVKCVALETAPQYSDDPRYAEIDEFEEE